MQDLEALSLQQLRELQVDVAAEIKRKEHVARAVARRAAYKLVRGRLCDYCGEEGSAVPVLHMKVPTGFYVGPKCTWERAFMVTPERWRKMRDLA